MNKKNIHILVGICSCLSARERRDAVRDTWLQHKEKGIESLFFAGGGIPCEDEKDMVVLDVPDGYNELPEKVLSFFKYALEHYDFDWLFKCDDDTYLRLDRLGELADPAYDLIGDVLVERRLSPSGGAGYFLSRRMVEKLVAVPDFPLWGAEDVIVGELVYKLGGKLFYTPRLYLANAYYPDHTNDMVSAHWCSPELMRGIYFMTNNQPVTYYMGEETGWSDEVQFFANGFFRRTQTSCYGQWRPGKCKELILDWQMWPRQQFLNFNDLYIGSSTTLRRKEGFPSLETVAQEYNLPPDDSLEGEEGLKVHLASGSRFLPGWLNLDAPHYGLDHPLPWEPDSIRALFLEDGLEKVDMPQLVRFFQEAFRVLLPGGILRISFTDYLRFSQGITPADRQKLREKRRTTLIPANSALLLAEFLGQKTILSREIMVRLLEEEGFSVLETEPGQSGQPYLRNLERIPEKEEIPAQIKGRICLEARKPLNSSRTFYLGDGDGTPSYVAPRFLPGHRTGNRLFQIAAVYAHALRNGLECRIPWYHNMEVQHLFKALEEAGQSCPDGGYDDETSYREPSFCYTPIPSGIRFGALEGFFQSEKYFSDFDAEIRLLFRKLTAPRRERVAGVHLRMGDYLERTDMYHSPDISFLEEAFNRLSGNIRELVIFSDSPHQALELVRAVPSARQFELSVDTQGTLDALKNLSSMQELVLSCSSFSWWAAYLGDQNKVFIQKDWFSGVIKDYEDVYREKWTRL